MIAPTLKTGLARTILLFGSTGKIQRPHLLDPRHRRLTRCNSDANEQSGLAIAQNCGIHTHLGSCLLSGVPSYA